jgi:ribosomal protein L11 methyltransferase
VRPVGRGDPELTAALAVAASVAGCDAALRRAPTQADGWLARSYASFAEQCIGRRFAVRGSHVQGPPAQGRITLTLDAGLAFGSGEHGSTRGALRALERVARRRPRRIVDLGTGSGILALAAARLLHRRVLAVDVEPRAVRVARQNARRNRVERLVRTRLANGWKHRAVRRDGPYDLVLANILARPLRTMAWRLSCNLAPGGSVVLGGFLRDQLRGVLAAHRRRGLRLEVCLQDADWTTLVMRRPRPAPCSRGPL